MSTNTWVSALSSVKDLIVVHGHSERMHPAIWNNTAIDDFTVTNSKLEQVCIFPVFSDPSVPSARTYVASPDNSELVIDEAIVLLPNYTHYDSRLEMTFEKFNTLRHDENVGKYYIARTPQHTAAFQYKGLGVWIECPVDNVLNLEEESAHRFLLEAIEPYEAIGLSVGHLLGLQVTSVGSIYLAEGNVPADVARQMFIKEHKDLPITQLNDDQEV